MANPLLGIYTVYRHVLLYAMQQAGGLAKCSYCAQIVWDKLQFLATKAALREASLAPTQRIECAASPHHLEPLLLGADITTILTNDFRL